MSDLVIGSGPAGVSVARALLARGRTVTMLDAGGEPGPGVTDRVQQMSRTRAEDWTAEARTAWMEPQFQAPEGEVWRYGTGYALASPARILAEGADWFALRASRAAGGLSNVWGAAVLPYRQADIDDWPITTDDLAPHYRAVAEIMPVSGQKDGLQNLFPACDMTGRTPIPPTAQAEMLLARSRQKAKALQGAGMHVGLARQAVGSGCQTCGLCLHGCPWSLIWSARQTRAVLQAEPGFTYRADHVVRQVREEGDEVVVTLADGSDVRGSRVFLATGVLESARILLASPGMRGKELVLKDSQQAFLPMLHRWRAPRRPDVLPYQTLPQLFAELDDPTVSRQLVHAQIYTWNEYYARDLKQNYGRLIPGSGPLLEALARRLIVAQVFLHSDHSHEIALRLAEDGRLRPELNENPATAETMRAALARYGRALRGLGLTSLSFAARFGAPGASFHVGGDLPMSDDPGSGESDVLGRPHGATRIHVVDASVLPTIPATTITFSVMANAHRIGTLAPGV
ncbi:GMC oxidoreductase [uncultured Ruegeria sp.]|uniref:GMC oxidoreductase n=1 Tax=uncultured Ruegeria sp. TaxID=259304 RepID=UPI00262CEBA6|nr:GMC oxidoreductase [uncultured Ruegeria sp.]